MSYSLPITPERVLRRVLPNGLVIVLCENQASASVALEGQILAGAILEPEGQEGLANLTAGLLRRGTQNHSFLETNQLLDDVGALLSISADDTYVNISGKSLADDLPLVLTLLSEMLIKPAFDDLEFVKSKGQLLTSLGIYQNDTGYRAGIAFDAALYPVGHPFGRTTYGTLETVKSLTNPDVHSYFTGYYHPATCVLALTGAINVPQTIDMLEQLLGGWVVPIPAPKLDIPMVETPAGVKRVQVPLPEKSQVDLIWGAIGVSRLNRDYYAAKMADIILGRLGLMGRLGSRIRDELGLAYYISSNLESGVGPQPWLISAGVNPTDIDQTVEELRLQVKRMREEPVSDEELADCRSYLIGAMPIDLETNADIADQILTIEEYDLGYDYLQRYADIVNSVTKADIQRVVYEHLDPDHYVLALAGTF